MKIYSLSFLFLFLLLLTRSEALEFATSSPVTDSQQKLNKSKSVAASLVFKSIDGGKTWELLRPSIENKVFNLSVSGNVIYAIPTEDGC